MDQGLESRHFMFTGVAELLLIVTSAAVAFYIYMVSYLFKMFKSRYYICSFLSSIIVNYNALHCLPKYSNIDCGVILFWLAETCKDKVSHSPIKLVILDRPYNSFKSSLNLVCTKIRLVLLEVDSLMMLSVFELYNNLFRSTISL
jgi:hypothetical protein